MADTATPTAGPPPATPDSSTSDKPATDQPDAKKPDPKKPDPKKPDPASAAGPDDDGLRAGLRDNARYVNVQYFNGPVIAPGSSFGQTSAAGDRQHANATGPVTGEGRDAALRYYVRPAGFDRALAILRRDRVVVLCGSAGIGKYAGGLALLRELTDGLPTNLSPALTFAELSAQKFGNTGGYLVRDHLSDTNAAAVQQFEVQRLLTAISGRSYLVITTDLGTRPRGPLADLMVDWAAPDPGQLFDRRMRDVSLDAQRLELVDTVRERVLAYSSPRDVLAIGAMLDDEPDRVLPALDNTWQNQVTAWFDGTPTVRDVLIVAALVFLDGMPEPVFERHLARLAELHRTLIGGPVAPAPAVPNEVMVASRGWTTQKLVSVVHTEDAQVTGGRCLTFTGGTDVQAMVVRVLHERYGFELWEPLRAWLNELAKEPPSPAHVRLGLGVALWSRCNFREIEQTFLEAWSAGLAPERLAAACTLSWIGLDGTHASAALGQVKGWTQNAGERRAATAASVLGGPLGLRYQSDALRWLWMLAMRRQLIRESAGVALGLLFAAAVADEETGRRMLNFLRRRLLDAIAPGESQTVRLATFETLLMVLQATDPETDLPVVATVLRRDSRNADRLGDIWAELLRSGKFRRAARTALLEALEPLSGDPAAYPAVARFGAAIRDNLPAAVWAALQDALDREARQREDDVSDLLTSVLAALRGTQRVTALPIRHRPGRFS